MGRYNVNYSRFDYFLLPDIEMMRDHQYVGYPMCRRGGYSYFEKVSGIVPDNGDPSAYFRTAVQQAVMDHKENSAAVYFKMANKHFTREQVSELVSAQFRSLITGTYTLYSSYNDAQSVFYFRAELAPGSRFQAVKGKKADAH